MNAQSAVELAGRVLESDQTGKLDDSILIQMLLELGHTVIANLKILPGDCFGILQGRTFHFIEEVAVSPCL